MLDTVDDVDDMSDEDFEASMLAEEGVDDYAKRGIYSPIVAYSDDDLEAFIDAIIVEFRDTWASKISFTIKKQDIDPANFLSVTTGFIMKNIPLRDQYVAIKTQKVNNVKTIAEIFGAFYENPEDLYESTHLDNYLVANITSPLELVREVTEFMGDKSSEIQQSNAGGTIKVTTTTGRIIDFPALDHEILVLYTKYLAFILVIFRILSDRADYAGEKAEAQSVGQFVSFVHTSLQQTGRSFMMDHHLVTHFANTPGKTDGNDKFAKSIQDDISRIIPEIVSIMDKFNIKRKER